MGCASLALLCLRYAPRRRWPAWVRRNGTFAAATGGLLASSIVGMGLSDEPDPLYVDSFLMQSVRWGSANLWEPCLVRQGAWDPRTSDVWVQELSESRTNGRPSLLVSIAARHLPGYYRPIGVAALDPDTLEVLWHASPCGPPMLVGGQVGFLRDEHLWFMDGDGAASASWYLGDSDVIADWRDGVALALQSQRVSWSTHAREHYTVVTRYFPASKIIQETWYRDMAARTFPRADLSNGAGRPDRAHDSLVRLAHGRVYELSREQGVALKRLDPRTGEMLVTLDDASLLDRITTPPYVEYLAIPAPKLPAERYSTGLFLPLRSLDQPASAEASTRNE